MLKVSRKILGFSSYKLGTSKIFLELNWLSFPQIIRYEATKMIYNINILSQPKSIIKFFNFQNISSDSRRLVRTPTLKYKPNMAKTTKSQLYRGVYYYSKLSFDIRVEKKDIFNSKLKSHIKKETSVYCMDRPIT